MAECERPDIRYRITAMHRADRNAIRYWFTIR
jgi:hypothetical protein